MTQCIKEIPLSAYSKETYCCQREAGYGLNGRFCQKHANMTTPEDDYPIIKMLVKEKP